VKTEQEAFAAFSSRALETACLVRGCCAWALSTACLVFAAPFFHASWKQSCACGTSFVTTIDHFPGPEGVEGDVKRLALPTYDGERVVVALEPATRYGSFAPGGAYRIGVQGRLDLFAAEMLERDWATLPEPRRAVFDLRATTEVTPPGADCITRLCAPDGASVATILLPAEEAQSLAALAGAPSVHATAADAIRALGPIPESSRRPITVTVRPRTLPA
jgi:hypothetical protein